MSIESRPFSHHGFAMRLKVDGRADPDGAIKDWLDRCVAVLVENMPGASLVEEGPDLFAMAGFDGAPHSGYEDFTRGET